MGSYSNALMPQQPGFGQFYGSSQGQNPMMSLGALLQGLARMFQGSGGGFGNPAFFGIGGMNAPNAAGSTSTGAAPNLLTGNRSQRGSLAPSVTGAPQVTQPTAPTGGAGGLPENPYGGGVMTPTPMGGLLAPGAGRRRGGNYFNFNFGTPQQSQQNPTMWEPYGKGAGPIVWATHTGSK